MKFKEGELKMKKLLVLLMVLGLATSAQAALSLSLSATTVDIGDTVQCDVVDSVGENWTWQFLLTEDTYNWTSPVAADYDPDRVNATTIHTAAGNNAAIEANPTYAAVLQLTAAGTDPVPAAGTQFTIDIKGEALGTIYVDLVSGSTYASQVGGATALEVVPEPMTIALLGLGGLFLRRRK